MARVSICFHLLGWGILLLILFPFLSFRFLLTRSELFIPNKRIPALSGMGRAGGDKYTCAGTTRK
jgi:hypothetical protein